MKLRWRRFSLAAVFVLGLIQGLRSPGLVAQGRGGGRSGGDLSQEQDEPKLPNGKSQRDEILKLEREQNIKDAAQLSQMVEELRQDLEKNDRYVLSLSTLKKTDDIEKLVRKIRSRLRHN